MDLNKTLAQINENRDQVEAAFVFSLWRNPELYGDYKTVNAGKDKTLKSEDAKFYFALGRTMFEAGYQSFDSITVHTFLNDKPAIKTRFEKYGGWKEVENLMALVNESNVEAYFDKIAKTNTLTLMASKYEELFSDVGRFKNASNEDVYEAFELLNNSVSLETNHDSKIEDLVIDEEYIEECNSGENVGLSYAKGAPLLNYATLGLPVGDVYMLASHSGCGKAQPLDTPIITPNGPVKMGDIKIGDMVISEDGKAYPVTGVFPKGKLPAYEVTFNDGTKVVCNNEHLWKFKTFYEQRRHYTEPDGGYNAGWKVDTLENILSKNKFQTYNNTFNIMIPVAKPIEDFAQQEELPIPPYSLGVLLGDGSLCGSSIQLTNPERDIVDKVADELSDVIEIRDTKCAPELQHMLVSSCGHYNKLRAKLIDLGLNVHGRDKFIPRQYMYADKENRLQLLKGLIDTDGSVNRKGAITFNTTSQMLASQVAELVRSLGRRCSVHVRDREDKKSIEYAVRVFGKAPEFFTSNKHNDRFARRIIPNRETDYRYMRMVKVEKLSEDVEMQCISVASPEHTYLCGDYIVTHNTSFIFENMVMPLATGGTPCCILSNEMGVNAYKNLLLVHILTKDLNYWKIARKKLKVGNFTEEEMQYLHKAAEISKEKYSHIKFVKLFDNDSSKIMKYIRRLSRTGTKAFFWDTFKNDDSAMDERAWQQLLLSSRRIFNLVSKEQVALVTTFQLALYTINQRFLDAGCLSSSKQIKEVVSEIVMMRRLWQDEFPGQKYDCHPYRLSRDNSKVREPVQLDPNKTYNVCILDKTRNGEDKVCILYEWQGAWNTWHEVGFCTIVNDHKSYN